MDNIHSNWDDVDAVAMALELSDPNQPYSCSSWGGQFNQSEPLIVNGEPISISLEGEHIAYTGKYQDPDKTMPARSSTWRN